MYEYGGILGLDPRGYSYGQITAMVTAHLKQDWLMFGRIAVDLMNSQRSAKDRISPIGLYPFFEKPPVRPATKEDELRLAEQLKDSKWLKVTTS